MTVSAAIYARQSEDVAEGIERQLDRCRRLVEARGWKVARTYTDNDVSATKDRGNGTGWAQMLRDLEADAADVVVAVDIDRLLRTVRDLVDITATGAKVLTVDGEIDLTTADGEFRATMLTGIARFEVRRKSERQKRANEARTASGRPVPGRRRFGYETDGITPRTAEAVVVKRMFEHVASGGSVRSIAMILNGEGHSTVTGRPWSNVRLRDVLLNPHYSGHVRHLGTVTPSEIVTPIVDESLAADVRAILLDPSRRTNPGPKAKHVLSGLMSCGVCGDLMFFMRSYRCRKDTTHPSIIKKNIEPYVRDEIAKAFISGGSDLFPTSGNGPNIAALNARHALNTNAVAATIADRDEGLVPASVARSRLIELKAAREAIEMELERARTEKSSAGALLAIAQDLIVKPTFEMHEFKEMKETVLERFDTLDIDRQREIVRALLHIEIAPGRDRSRIWIEHKLALHLNPDAETESRYYS